MFDRDDPTLLINILAPATGADRYAAGAARALNIPVHTVPALWSHEGRKAGPVRNARMLQWAVLLGSELRLPVLVLAFPGGVGTANMVKRARARGLDVIDSGRAPSGQAKVSHARATLRHLCDTFQAWPSP